MQYRILVGDQLLCCVGSVSLKAQYGCVLTAELTVLLEDKDVQVAGGVTTIALPSEVFSADKFSSDGVIPKLVIKTEDVKAEDRAPEK